MDRRGVELAWLIALAGLLDIVAGTGLAYVAGTGATCRVLRHPQWPWLIAMIVALGVSFAGYYGAYHGVYQADGGYRLPRRRLFAVVTAGFGGFFSHWGTTPDDLALQLAGAGARESIVRASALGGVEQAVLALAGCAASIVALSLGQPVPLAATLPWAIIPVPAAILICWVAARLAPGLRARTGWRDKVSVGTDIVRLARCLFQHPIRHWLALAGTLTFWTAEMFAVWAGLAAFGVRMDVAALIVGFCTGMVFTRRIAPLAGAGMLTLVLPLAIWYCGAPLPAAVAGTFAYRVLTLWLPMPVALATLPVLRQLRPGGTGPTPVTVSPTPVSPSPVSGVPAAREAGRWRPSR